MRLASSPGSLPRKLGLTICCSSPVVVLAVPLPPILCRDKPGASSLLKAAAGTLRLPPFVPILPARGGGGGGGAFVKVVAALAPAPASGEYRRGRCEGEGAQYRCSSNVGSPAANAIADKGSPRSRRRAALNAPSAELKEGKR